MTKQMLRAGVLAVAGLVAANLGMAATTRPPGPSWWGAELPSHPGGGSPNSAIEWRFAPEQAEQGTLSGASVQKRNSNRRRAL